MSVTPSVIEAINALADKDNQKGLRIASLTGQVLCDSSWTAGVDCDETDGEETLTQMKKILIAKMMTRRKMKRTPSLMPPIPQMRTPTTLMKQGKSCAIRKNKVQSKSNNQLQLKMRRKRTNQTN